MADAYILDIVKDALGITGTFQDAALKIYIDDIKGYMRDAGVSEETITDKSTAGVIARGVMDIWANGSGSGELSNYFIQRVTQLTYKGGGKNG